MSERSAATDAVYQELLLDHYRRPRNRGELPDADVTVEQRNPLCGDTLTLQLELDKGRVREARFTGQGCAISQASASMMTQLLKGKTIDEALALRERFRSMMLGDTEAVKDKTLGDLRALSGVARLPVRVKCALLAFSALEEGLRTRGAGLATRDAGEPESGERTN